jgi:chemotaxis protein MotB
MALPPDDPPPGVPEWVVTYGDMMSLLLTFFIMLVSMAEVKQEGKMRMMLNSLQQRFGPTDGLFGAPGPAMPTNSAMPHAASSGDRSEGGTKKAGRKSAGLAGPSTSVQRIGQGTQITLGGPALFERFSAELSEGAKQDLATIAAALAKRPNRIVIRGHATRESLPAGSPYPDAHALAFARAFAGYEHLIACGINPTRVSVASAGDGEPRSLSRTAEGQRENRRIDVFVVETYITPATERTLIAPGAP